MLLLLTNVPHLFARAGILAGSIRQSLRMHKLAPVRRQIDIDNHASSPCFVIVYGNYMNSRNDGIINDDGANFVILFFNNYVCFPNQKIRLLCIKMFLLLTVGGISINNAKC